MRTLWAVGLVVGCFAFTACRPSMVELTEKGAEVRQYKRRPKGEYELVDSYTCRRSMNGRSPATNQQICENEIRNKAGRDGADIVVMDATHEPRSNYVSITARAYRKVGK